VFSAVFATTRRSSDSAFHADGPASENVRSTNLVPCSRGSVKLVGTHPLSNLGRVHRHSHVRECTLLLRVLAAQCVTLRKRYGTLRCVTDGHKALRNRYETFRNVIEALQGVTERCGALWNCYETRNVTEASRKRYGALRNVMEHYGALRNITEALRDVTERNGSVMEPVQNVAGRYGRVTEPLRNVADRYEALRGVAGR